MARYEKEHYDRVIIKVPKGEKEQWREFAKKKNQSINSYVIQSVRDQMERDAHEK